METLRLFCQVAKHHSFSLAASEQSLTQSAVSQRINALEKKLNVKLIDRSVRPLALTAAGEMFYREVRELVERYDRVEQRLTQMHAGLAGHIVIEAIYSAGIELLNKIKESFERDHPKVRVDIFYKRLEEVYDAVAHERCDLGILSYPRRWPGVGVVPLRDERMTVVCRPGHDLAERESVHASELGPWPMVGLDAGLPVARRVRGYLRDHGVHPTVAGQFDNIDTVKTALREVAGSYAILPRRTVAREVEEGLLTAVTLEPSLMRPMGIIYPRRNGAGGAMSPLVQTFVDALLKHAGPTDEVVAAASLESLAASRA